MAKLVERSAPWLRWIAPNEFDNTELFRIVTFFVFHSPCPNLSSMGKSLSEYGWSAPWRKPFHLNRQLKQAASNYNLIFSADNYDSLEEALKKADLSDSFPSKYGTERIAMYDTLHNQFLSIFYHIRNSFAHGRMNMVDYYGECVFILEDVLPKKDTGKLKVSARMIIKKSTLLKWIDIIEQGEKEFKK